MSTFALHTHFRLYLLYRQEKFNSAKYEKLEPDSRIPRQITQFWIIKRIKGALNLESKQQDTVDSNYINFDWENPTYFFCDSSLSYRLDLHAEPLFKNLALVLARVILLNNIREIHIIPVIETVVALAQWRANWPVFKAFTVRLDAVRTFTIAFIGLFEFEPFPLFASSLRRVWSLQLHLLQTT